MKEVNPKTATELKLLLEGESRQAYYYRQGYNDCLHDFQDTVNKTMTELRSIKEKKDERGI